MEYQIFELIQNSRLETDGYYTKTICNYTLEQDTEYPEAFSTFEEAQTQIDLESGELKCKKLTILPVFDIDYEGNIAGIN